MWMSDLVAGLTELDRPMLEIGVVTLGWLIVYLQQLLRQEKRSVDRDS